MIPYIHKQGYAARFQCAIVMCDHAWLDPDMEGDNGVLLDREADMLRMDVMILTVQLNVMILTVQLNVHQLMEVRLSL